MVQKTNEMWYNTDAQYRWHTAQVVWGIGGVGHMCCDVQVVWDVNGRVHRWYRAQMVQDTEVAVHRWC